MNNSFRFIYSRRFRLFLTLIELTAACLAIVFVASSDIDLFWKIAMYGCVAVVIWESGLALSLYVVTKEYIDHLISLMVRTTRRFALRPYVFVATMITYSFAALYVISYGNVEVYVLFSLLLIVLIGDKLNSLYMTFIIAQIADKEETAKKPKKDPKNPLQK